MAYNTDILNDLSPEEREIALEILKQYADEGKSETLDKILMQDYTEMPVDIITFIKDPLYLGKAWHLSDGTCKLFPYWEETLKEIFPDNLTTNFNTFIKSGARGIGKSEIAVTCGLYLMHRLMCLRNPHDYLNLKTSEQVTFAFMNIKIALAENIGISKYQKTVQMSPWFLERGTISGTRNKKWNPPSFINVVIGSQPDDVIGQAIYFFFMDEISFIRNQDVEVQKKKALDLIDTALGGMKTRFLNKGKNPTLMSVASSKRSEISFLEEYIKKKSETDADNTYIVDEPVWNVRPSSEYSGEKFYVALGNKFLTSEVIRNNENIEHYRNKGYRIIEVPIEFYTNFIENIDRALRDYAGISSSELSTYISGERIANIKVKTYVNAFTKEIITVGDNPKDFTQYSDYFDLNSIDPKLKSRPLYLHFDTSLSGDKTGIAGTWAVGKRLQKENELPANEMFYKLAFAVAVKAPKGYQISFAKHRQFIYYLKENGFNIKGISSDSYQSANFKQDLQKDFNFEIISVDRTTDGVCKPYHYLKTTIYDERLEIFDMELLTDELIGLERNASNGKIDHSPSGINSKDVADALTGSVWHASMYATEFAYNYGEIADAVAETNIPSNESAAKKQVIVDFEKELQLTLDPVAKAIERDKKLIEKERAKPVAERKEVESQFLDFGLGKAQEINHNYIADNIVWW